MLLAVVSIINVVHGRFSLTDSKTEMGIILMATSMERLNQMTDNK